MRFFFLLLIALVASTSHGEDVREFSSKIPYFYLHSTAEDFSNFQKTANGFENDFKSANPGTNIILALMTAKISEKNGWPIQNTFFSSQAKEILEGKSELAKFIANDDAVNPSKLDFWWASFFATGDEKYLLNLLKYVGEEPPKNDVAKTMIVGAASWSFKANSKQHKTVRDFAEKMSKDESLSLRKRDYLLNCVQYADNKT